MNKINLGSGGLPMDGCINVDKSPNALNVNIIHDLDVYPWPFESNWADEIFSSL